MKLNHLRTKTKTAQLVQKFGQANLLRQSNGQYDLIGGTIEEVATAKDWVSLVAHEVVLNHKSGDDMGGTGEGAQRVVIRLHTQKPVRN